MWSIFSILLKLSIINSGELLTGKIRFFGDSEISQLYKIFKVMGTPNSITWPGVCKLPFYNSFFPQWKREKKELNKVIGEKRDLDFDTADLLKSFLIYDPYMRLSASEGRTHRFFDNF